MKGICFLPTKDLALTNLFYHDVLDLEPALDQGSCIIYRVGASYWGFCESESEIAIPEQVTLTLVVDEVDDYYQLFLEAGVPVYGPPRENTAFKIYHFYGRDPNGYRLEVQRFLHDFM